MPAHDRYPVKKGHLLVIPFRHAADYFSLTVEEKHAVPALIDACKEVLLREYARSVSSSCQISHKCAHHRMFAGMIRFCPVRPKSVSKLTSTRSNFSATT